MEKSVTKNTSSFYTDDIMVISHEPRPILDKLNVYFLLKPDSIGRSNLYLGVSIPRFTLKGDLRLKWAKSLPNCMSKKPFI
jgi:hypothetical protein